MLHNMFDNRFWVGFDDMRRLHERLLEDNYDTFPKYNIRVTSPSTKVLELAVAGYKKQDLSVTKEDNYLKIAGKKQSQEGVQYAVQGISSREFQRTFAIGDYTEVKDITLVDGILTIEVEDKLPIVQPPKQLTIR